MQGADYGDLLRAGYGDEPPVTPFELFFDLVFVFAVTQLSRRLVDHLTLGGALETLMLLLVVWSAWITTTWVANWFDPNQLWVRLMLGAVMLASLFMSAAIPQAFSHRGLMFAGAYVTIHVGRAAFAFLTLRNPSGEAHQLSRPFQRALVWFVAAGLLWLSGGLLEGRARYVLWTLGLAMNYGAPLMGYYIPGLGRSRSRDWTIEGGHIAERCQLFIIIALGESLLITGVTFAQTRGSAAATLALLVAFFGSVALWWVYFDRSAEAARETISRSENPGRVARSAYNYFHIPMIAGIIAFAAADRLTVAAPAERGTLASVALTLGGPASFLAGHALYKRAVFRIRDWPHLIAIAVLAILVPVGFASQRLVLNGLASLIVVALAVWETLTDQRYGR